MSSRAADGGRPERRRTSSAARRGSVASRWLDAGTDGRARQAGRAVLRSDVQRKVEWFAVVWFVLWLSLDILILHGVVLIGTVNLSTLLLSAVSTFRRVAAFAIASVAVAALCPLWNSGIPTSTQVVRVVNTALIGVVALLITVLRDRRELQVVGIEAAAEAAQRAVLPTLPPQVGQVGIAARYHSAADEAMVGGDVFDMYYNESGKVVALVGDVAGHGLASVEEGARLIRAFRQYAPTSENLDQLAAVMNAYITPFLGPEVFVTAVIVDVSSCERFSVVSCGHPAPLLLHQSKLVAVPVEHDLPLGLGAQPRSQTYPWSPGDRLLLHTDGLLESRDRQGRFLGTAAVGEALHEGSSDEAVDRVIAVVEHHVGAGRLRDDVCLMVLENRGPGGDRPPGPLRGQHRARGPATP